MPKKKVAIKPKYYIYVSDTKVDMLFSQIPQPVRTRISTELKVDLKLLSASFTSKEKEETRYSKLKVTIDYLQENSLIGTIRNPREYFKGNMYMNWFELIDGITYFGGHSDKTIVGLGGSTSHLIGGGHQEAAPRGSSHSPWLLSALIKELQLPIGQPVLPGHLDEEENEYRLSHAIAERTQKNLFRNPPQRFEFLARKLFSSNSLLPDRSEFVVLGTPLYVAFAN